MHPLSPDPIAQSLTAEGITALCDNALANAEELAAGIRTLKDADTSALTWSVTFGAFDRITHQIQEAACLPQLIALAHPEASVRTAAQACDPKVDAFASALLMDDAVAKTLRRAAEALNATPLSPAQQKLITETLRDYRRNGLELPPEGRAQLKKLNEELTALGQQFEQNIAADTPSITVTPEQLDGLSDAFKAAHPATNDGTVTLTTNYPDLVPFLRDAKDRAAARELYKRSQNRAHEKNLPILDKLLTLRKQKADLLGYKTWAHYVLEPRMAKSPEAVAAFLTELHTALKPKREKEMSAFTELAERLALDRPEEGIWNSDAAYLEEILRKETFNVDAQKISEYFEVRAVQQGILDTAAALYNLRFEPTDVPAWHEDVTPFNVHDDATNTLIGRVYLDLYPRDNKYKHAAVFGLRETIQQADGTRVLPLAALVCNFPKSDDTNHIPGLLTHGDVTTFFHEFGHLLHHILSESPLASFAGTNVARDFVEAPSQLFEEWAWDQSVLNTFAKHHKTGESLPNDLFQALARARTFNEAIFTERQLFLATFDQTLHTQEPGLNTSDVLAELHPEFSGFTRIPDTHFQANFGHLIGYDAAYYGYQWALAIAHDLRTRFLAEGLTNTETANNYRRAILAPGGSQDEHLLVEQFLGRPTSTDAYKRYLGI